MIGYGASYVWHTYKYLAIINCLFFSPVRKNRSFFLFFWVWNFRKPVSSSSFRPAGCLYDEFFLFLFLPPKKNPEILFLLNQEKKIHWKKAFWFSHTTIITWNFQFWFYYFVFCFINKINITNYHHVFIVVDNNSFIKNP